MQTIRGLKPAITHTIAVSQEVLDNGPRALLSSLEDASQFKYVSEVVEVIAVTANGALKMNTHTFFLCAGESHTDVDQRITRILSDLNVCQECIRDGMPSILTCKRQSPTLPCSNCADRLQHCHSLLVLHCFADMASTQAKAHRLRSPKSHASVAGTLQPSFGHGYLHIAKSFVAACRNYHLTNGFGEFSIIDLTALHMGLHAPSRLAFSGVNTLIHSYKDRHSDELAFHTVSAKCEEALQLAEFTKVTLVPEQYHAYRAKNHEWIQRPLCVACTKSGRFFWSDFDSQRIFVGDRHNPVNLFPVSASNANGTSHDTTGSMKCVKLQTPTGLAVISTSATELCEALFVCTSGLPGLAVLLNVHDVSNKSSTWITPTWSKNGVPKNFRAFAVTSIGVNQCAVVDKWSGSVYVIDYVGNGQEFRVARTIQGFLKPTSAAALTMHGEVWILVATASGLKAFEVRSRNDFVDVPCNVPCDSVFGVAVWNDQVVCVTVPSKNQCHILTLRMIEGDRRPHLDLVIVVGDGSPGITDGSGKHCQLNEPCGVSARNGVFLVCCIAGEGQGSICRISATTFAQTYVASVRAIYEAGDFLPLQFKARTAAPRSCLTEGIGRLKKAITFFDAMELDRRAAVGVTPCGIHGCFPVRTLQCLTLTRDGLEKCSLVGTTLSALSMSGTLTTKAFLDESVVEFSFGHHSLHGINRSRSLEEYSHGKHHEARAVIRRLCRTEFSYFVKESRYYAPGDECPVNADTVLGAEGEIFLKIAECATPASHNTGDGMTEREREVTIANMRRICSYLRAQPTQTVRDKYRKACGYAPTIVLQKVDTAIGERQLDRITEEVRVSLNRIRSKARSTNIVTSNQFLAYEGDFVVVEPDAEWIEEESQRGSDPLPFWLFQLLEPIRVGQNRPHCIVNGVWLEFMDVDSDGCRRYIIGESQAIRFMKLLVDGAGDVFVVPWDHTFNAKVIGDDETVVYRFKAHLDDVIAEISCKYSGESQGTEGVEELITEATDDADDIVLGTDSNITTEKFERTNVNETRKRTISTRFRGNVKGYAELAKA